MKKILSVVLVLIMLCSLGLTSTFVFAAEKDLVCGEFKYRVLEDGTAAITGFSSPNGIHITILNDIEIPATVDEYPVTVIAQRAFFDQDYIRSVVIPEGVVTIDDYAFMHCETIDIVKLPNTIRVIGRGAFLRCQRLTDINLPEGLAVIEKNAFSACSKLRKVNIPSTVVEIGDHAYAGTMIVGSEFSLPDNLQKLGEHILNNANCDNKYSDIWYDGAIYVNNYLIGVDEKTKGEVVVREDTKLIADGAFNNCEYITSVVIPEGITELGHSTFSGCKSLTDVKLPNTLTDIGSGLFWGCGSLEEVQLPSGITGIHSSTFNGCTSLKKVTLPENLSVIDPYAFKDCTSLESVNIPENVKSIGLYAFENCNSLTSVVIPEGAETIGKYAFLDCDNLKDITIPDTVTSIDEIAFGYYSVESGFDWDYKIEYFTYDDVVIRGYKDSAAQEYAQANGIRFIEIPEETVLGDVDADGEVTVKDATLLQKFLADIAHLYQTQKNHADTNADNALNIKDATCIQKMVAGME